MSLAPGAALTPDFLANVQQVLADPSNLPPEFRNWVTQWVEAFPPLIPLSQVAGYALSTTYAIATTPAAVATGTTPVAVSWTAKRKDSSAMWSNSAQTKLTCKQAGAYSVSAFLDWGTNATGVRMIWVKLNGATFIAGDDGTPTAQGCPLSAKGLIDLQVNDFLEVYAIQNSGGNITPAGFFTAVRVSPT